MLSSASDNGPGVLHKQLEMLQKASILLDYYKAIKHISVALYKCDHISFFFFKLLNCAYIYNDNMNMQTRL